MEKKKTLVIGASSNPSRYSYLAVQKLSALQYPVVALGAHEGAIGSTVIETQSKPFDHIDTVTLYLHPAKQAQYYDYIFSLQPKRIIFNPGAENEIFAQAAAQKGITAINACTLVLLSTGQY